MYQFRSKDSKYSYNDKMLTAQLTMPDDSQLYIFILANDMIFVADCDYNELQRRIDADESDTFEAYDLTDGSSYYLSSKYAYDISDALLQLINFLLK